MYLKASEICNTESDKAVSLVRSIEIIRQTFNKLVKKQRFKEAVDVGERLRSAYLQAGQKNSSNKMLPGL